MLNKKTLIELFEYQLLEGEELRIVYTKSRYQGIEFYMESRLSVCKMHILEIENVFYLTFNSIHILINKKDFSYLQKILLNKENEKDFQLLKEIFGKKNKSEKRKTITEKRQHEN